MDKKKSIGNALDSVIEWLSPQWATGRYRARAMLNLAKRNYSAADRGRRTGNWNTRMGRGPNSDFRKNLPLIRERCRDLVRNNPWAASFIHEIVANIVHYGIIATFSGYGRKLSNGKVPDSWLKWAETPQIDAARRQNLYGLQRLWVKTWAESGACYIRRVWRRDWKPGEIPFALQTLEPEYIDTSRDGTDGCKLGMKFDDYGVCQGYYVFARHPGEGVINESFFVPASEMIHLYMEDRPGQIDGVPLMAPIALRLFDLDTFEQAELIKQEVASMFAGYIKKNEFYAGAGGVEDDENKQKGTVQDQIEPGALEILEPDQDIVFSNPPQRSGYGEYVKQNLMAVAAGGGTTYESLSGDYGRVTFLNGRMGQLRFTRKIDQWQYLMVIPQALDRLAQWYIEGAQMVGENLSNINIGWQPPIKQLVDPGREGAALENDVRMGRMTPFELISANGSDPVAFLDACEEQWKEIRKRGLLFTTDVQNVSGAGQLQVGGDNDDEGGAK